MSILYYFVDEETRKLRPEAAHKVVAQKDHDTDVIRVGVPETLDSVDLETSAVRCMYQRPKETEVRSKTAAYYETTGGYLWYDWTLQEGDTAKAGTINFSVCLQHIEGSLLTADWNTTIGEIHVKTSYHSDDSDEGDESITPTVAQRVAVLESVIHGMAGGAPVVVDSASDMTDTGKLYVLSTDGYWYYYDGSAWVAGGEYGAVPTDTTLTQSGIPADAKAVGDEFDAQKFANDVLGLTLLKNDTSVTQKNGLTFTWDNNVTVHISGTLTAGTFVNLVVSSPENIGDSLVAYCKIISGSFNAVVSPQGQLYFIGSGSQQTSVNIIDTSKRVAIPGGTTNVVYRIYCGRGTYNDVKLMIYAIKGGHFTDIAEDSYLAPTGDTADRTSDIFNLLNSSGICKLGAGEYYVKDLVMPNNSAIIGCGFSTKVILADDGAFAIAPKSYCTVKDLQIAGGVATPSQTVGNRHGILWQGDYAASRTAPYMSTLSNLMITDFSGGGITCNDTGYATNNFVEAVNILIKNCSAGINIAYWSEFHKFTNVRCYGCYYGCINNGGNNIFVNCDFSSCLGYAMMMDNSENQSPNNTHGSCIGCVFNHTASNTGIGVAILNGKNGFIFDGCQIFFSKVHLENSDGVVFSNCNFGNTNCDIEISGGKAIIFGGNIFQNTPPITVSGDAEVHFVNCYNRTTGALVTV